jgi:hypothetical protein
MIWLNTQDLVFGVLKISNTLGIYEKAQGIYRKFSRIFWKISRIFWKIDSCIEFNRIYESNRIYV